MAFLRINGIVLKGEADGYAADFVLALLHGELTLEQAQIWIIDNIRD